MTYKIPEKTIKELLGELRESFEDIESIQKSLGDPLKYEKENIQSVEKLQLGYKLGRKIEATEDIIYEIIRQKNKIVTEYKIYCKIFSYIMGL